MEGMFRMPGNVGGGLSDFAQGELNTLLVDKICGKENRFGENCNGECSSPNCMGWVASAHLVNQIGEAGIEFMKSLVEEWAK